ncbi:MAG: YidB family protein [Deltaproteobacteria bacterium]
MSKSTPSLLALLGLVAIAGYQNRGKLTEMLGDGSTDRQPGAGASQDESLVDRVGAMFGSGIGGVAGGLIELVDRFRSGGQGAAADSWISNRENATIGEGDIESVLGEDTISELSEKTGLSRSELLNRLSQGLPAAVNTLTPDGRLPLDSTLEIGSEPYAEGGPVTLQPPRGS